MPTSKVFKDAAAALSGLTRDGMTVMTGGFGLCGIPENLIVALRDSGVKNLTVISNNAGVDGFGLGCCSRRGRSEDGFLVRRREQGVRAPVPGGELELEFNPQGTLAERIRAGGAGIAGFYTRTGVGTVVAEGKETTRRLTASCYVLETGLTADLSIVKAWKGDTEGNLIFRKTARNFNPMMATAGESRVAEVEISSRPVSSIRTSVHTPGIYVHRIVQGRAFEKRIEQRTVRKRGECLMPWTRDQTWRNAPPGIARWLLRESRHRHSDAGRELHSRRHGSDAAVRERHARHGPLSRTKVKTTPI